MAYYRSLVRFIAVVHTLVMVMNTVAIPLLIIYEPFWIWMPIITFLVNPMVGGSYCFMNRLENLYREKAGMPLINDRGEEIIKLFRR